MTFEEFLLSIRDFFTGTVFPALGTFATSRVFPALIIAVVGILIIKILLRVLKAALSHLDKAFTKLFRSKKQHRSASNQKHPGQKTFYTSAA